MHSGLRHDMLLMLRHTAEPASEASCCNLLIVFCSFSLDGQIFGDILSVFIPQSSELAYSGEMENTWIAGWGRERERAPSGFKCVIEWAGMGMKKHWLWLIQFISLEEFLWWLLPCSNTALEQCASGTSASPKCICHTRSLYASSRPRYLYSPLWAA